MKLSHYLLAVQLLLEKDGWVQRKTTTKEVVLDILKKAQKQLSAEGK